jgi:hypothetical protein
MLASDNLEPLNLPKNVNKPYWVHNRELAERLYISNEEAVLLIAMRKHKGKEVKSLYGRNYINLNDLRYKGEVFNTKREYYFITMFDNLYFELTRYLSQYEVSKLFAAIDNTHSQRSWNTYMQQYHIQMNERALLFMQLAKKALNTKALVKNYKRKW